MDSEAIMAFTKALNLNLKVSDRWLRGKCPFGWLHAGGEDRHPSFGIEILDDAPSWYFCFGCGRNGSLRKLLHTLTFRHSYRYREASMLLAEYEIDEEESGTKAKFVDPYKSAFDEEKIQAVPQAVLDQFPLITKDMPDFDAFSTFFEGRKISLSTVERYRLRCWKYLDSYPHVVFPLIGYDGLCWGLHSRSIRRKIFFEITEKLIGSKTPLPTVAKTGMLFGLDKIDYDRPVLVVESCLDVLRLYDLGFGNAVATAGPIRRSQLGALCFPTIVLGFDADDAGRASAERVKRQCKALRMFEVDWGDVGVKDPGELQSKHQLTQALKRAKKV